MDKRKLKLKNCLHKNLQLISQSSKKPDYLNDKHTSPHTDNVTIMEDINSSNSERLSSIASLTLIPSSYQSSVRSGSSTKNRKKACYENEENMSEAADSTITRKLLNTPKLLEIRASTPKQANSQISGKCMPYATSQEENIGLNNSISRKGNSTTDASVIKSVTRKRKLAMHNAVENGSDSNLDLASNEDKIIKKKYTESIFARTTQYIAQDATTDNNSSRKEKLQNRITRTHLTEESKRYEINIRGYSQEEQSSHISSVFSNFLQKCGITSTDGVHILNVPPFIAKQKMKKILNSTQYQKKDIIKSIEEYCQNEENLKKMLNNMELCVENRGFGTLNSTSLLRILLEVTEIQTDIYNYFIWKLNESILLTDTPNKIPWIVPLLHQFRFLDTIVNVDTLTVNIEQLLETCPTWFQHEFILLLPDILSDVQHQKIAEILTGILEENCELTTVILNCISSFNLTTEYLEEYKNKVLYLLKTSIKIEDIPAVIRFLFNNCVSHDIIKQMLHILRDIEILPLAGDKVEEYYKSQVQVVKTLKLCMLLAKDVTHAVITIMKDINKNPKPLDLIILLLISSGTIKQKNAQVLLKQNIQCGFYRISLLHTLYNDYKEVVRELQPLMLQLAGKLLKSEEPVFINFAIEWFRLQFLSQREALFKQREIIEKIILLMGNNDQTVKHALTILCKMTKNTNERDCLVPHCNHLRILLEKIDYFGLEEIGTLSDLLHSLCSADDSISELLRDDLSILLQKQLSAAKSITKCKGVMGAVMAIKHLAGKAETCDQAFILFNQIMKSVKSCSKSQPLFYDQLAQVIMQTELINIDFLQKINKCIENTFVSTYMTDKPLPSSEDLVPRYGLNDTENEQQKFILNFGNKKSGPIAPILFKLFKTCCIRLSEHGELEAIDALLGCSILMPQDLDIPEPAVLDRIICSINWFREIIIAFVTQIDPLLQSQVLKRLDTLIYLQYELSTLLTLCDTKYQPPPCYFHYFPTPLFVKIEKRVSRKGKKPKKKNKFNTSLNTENKYWEIGSMLCSKNPAYFRQFDAKIAHLLDVKIDLQSSQSKTQVISITQVCFLVNELLAILENDPTDLFIRDLIYLLPKISSKLDDVICKLRKDNNHNFREGARLLLLLLTTIFNWKGFLSVTYNTLLREGLRTLARQVNEENIRLRSCKELVAESYKYFESLSDIATEISLATALVNICQSLMKHSETYMQQYKDKHAKLAYGFICLDWPEDIYSGSQYKLSIIQLLNNWIDNEQSPLNTVTLILEWLPNEVSNFENMQNLMRMPSINKNIFHLLYKKIFDGLIKGINVSLLAANSDSEKIKLWHSIASNVQKLVQICKTLKTKANIQLFLRYMPVLIKNFLNTGMPILEHNLKYQTDDITGILKMMQGGTRYLHAICCDCTERKDLILTKYVPVAKSTLEKLVYSVKGMLVLNDSATAFWMGNLINKDLDGREIFSQTSSQETTLPDMNVISAELDNASSEILDSDLGEDPLEEYHDEDCDIDDL